MTAFLLSFLIFLPLLAAVLILFLPNRLESLSKHITIGISLVNLLICIFLFYSFDKTITGYQFLEEASWINLDLGKLGVININYILGVDGISLPMVLLGGIVFMAAAVASTSIAKRPKAYFAFFLLLTSSVYGCFIALDFFLFFLFFEFMLLPMYFLIGIWGGERREYAAMKFIIYTLVGSVFVLIVMLAMGLSVTNPELSATLGKNAFTFDFRLLSDPYNYVSGSVLDANSGTHWFGWPVKSVLFILLLVGFGIKLPVVPFHTWLPDAHVEAPTAISVVLAGILLKVGGYAFLRIGMGFFPQEALDMAYIIAILGVLSIIYGAFNALAQDDLKKLIAYSSVSHMGFVFLGFAAFNEEGINGGIYQMFSHGILSSMLFLIVGVIYDRTHNRLIQNYRGLASKMPLFTGVVILAFFGSLGLPGISGFIGEFFSLLGAFKTSALSKWIPSLAVLGIVLSAVYLLWTLQRMFFGEFWVNRKMEEKMTDLNTKEVVLLFSLGFLAILFGIYPNLLLSISTGAVDAFLNK
ncbi:complex I subunit 4 family protein [Arcticibacterium luteifluviistationis]|uniref:Oxidoreductase n=1 Tax=Arcticibacterium luteifluviistationis TaxID=1784714 RepID=A0A2Z4G9G4_9BACT|nr:NADH-quinone oxidoreductase subunit M [Arcticibacterium luteifluviistationis]AWV97869.1 oxidoreductase [Arcticibacterium luteifluviistationis]